MFVSISEIGFRISNSGENESDIHMYVAQFSVNRLYPIPPPLASSIVSNIHNKYHFPRFINSILRPQTYSELEYYILVKLTTFAMFIWPEQADYVFVVRGIEFFPLIVPFVDLFVYGSAESQV